MNAWVSACAVWFAVLALSHVNAGGLPVDDHLLLVEEVNDAQSPEGAYERLWRKKLLVTPGEIARSVHLPGSVGVETAVSVYRSPLSNGEYRVTATQTSASLWRCVAPDAPEPVNPDSIEVERLEAPLAETTALAIQKVWRAMLLDVQKQPKSDEPLLESSTEIFSAAAPDGRLLTGQIQGLGKHNTAALSALANLLLQYCDSPETRRVEIAHRIEKAASVLLERIASSNGNKRRNARSMSASTAALMAPQQDTLQPIAGGTSESARTFALVTGTTEPRLGSSIDAFRTAWGSPIREEMLVRTATLTWRAAGQSNEEFPTGIFEAEVSFLERIACGIVLRSKRRTTPDKTIRLVQPVLPPFRAADFAKPRSDVNGIRVYDLEDGTSVSVKEHGGRMVIVIKGQCYLDNEAVFSGEAAKVRPPTSNH